MLGLQGMGHHRPAAVCLIRPCFIAVLELLELALADHTGLKLIDPASGSLLLGSKRKGMRHYRLVAVVFS